MPGSASCFEQSTVPASRRDESPASRPAIERCDAEIREAMSQTEPGPAYLVAMGIHDWEVEKRLIETEAKR